MNEPRLTRVAIRILEVLFIERMVSPGETCVAREAQLPRWLASPEICAALRWLDHASQREFHAAFKLGKRRFWARRRPAREWPRSYSAH